MDAFDHVYPRQRLGGPVTDLNPLPLPSSTSTKSTPSTSTSKTSTSDKASSTTGTLPSSSSNSTTLSAPVASPTNASISAISDPPVTVHTSTVTVQSSPNATPPSISSNTGNSSFLQNKVASGLVFTIVGVVGLALIMFIATFFLRRRRNRRLLEEAVSFDPVVVDYGDKETGSSIGHESIGTEVKPPSHYKLSRYGPPMGYGPHPVAQPYYPTVGRGSQALYDNTR